MNHVLSTHLFVNHRLTTVWLDRIWQAGIPAVEIFCAKQHLDWRDPAQMSDLAAWFRDSQLQLHSMHGPLFTDDVWGRSGPQSILSITETTKSKRVIVVDEIKRAIEIAEQIPCRYLIQHIGTVGEEFSEQKVEAAFTALEEIKLFAHQRGVEVLLENTPNGFSSAERLEGFLQVTHLKLNYCFDIGHAHIGAGVEHEFAIMKPRIRSTHLHDNDGKEDRHLFPVPGAGAAGIDWHKAIPLVHSCTHPVPLLLELKEAADLQHPVEEAARVFETLESYL